MAAQTEIKALLFDFDGTLWDSEIVGLRLWEEAFRSHGVRFPFGLYVSRLGTIGGVDPLAHLEQLLDHEVDRAAITRRRLRRKRQLLNELQPQAGVSAYLSEAERLGLRIAIVSSDDAAYVKDGLTMMGLIADWSLIVCADGDANRAKPSPILYLEALDKLGLEPKEAIVIEDSPNGISAAQRAGIFCVAVPNSVTRRLDLSRADLVVPGLDRLPLSALLKHVTAEGSSSRQDAGGDG